MSIQKIFNKSELNDENDLDFFIDETEKLFKNYDQHINLNETINFLHSILDKLNLILIGKINLLSMMLESLYDINTSYDTEDFWKEKTKIQKNITKRLTNIIQTILFFFNFNNGLTGNKLIDSDGEFCESLLEYVENEEYLDNINDVKSKEDINKDILNDLSLFIQNAITNLDLPSKLKIEGKF